MRKPAARDDRPVVKPFILGLENFTAISAVEGLTLTSASKARLKRNGELTQGQRRAEAIRAFRSAQSR